MGQVDFFFYVPFSIFFLFTFSIVISLMNSEGRFMTKRLAIYPGSFDPLTCGHMSLIERGLRVFDTVVVAIAINPRKSPLFSTEERLAMIRDAFPGEERVEVDTFEGLLVDYTRQKGAPVILRGLRAVSDFEYELQMANMNRKLDDQIETMFMMTEETHFYVSSSLIKEVARFGGAISEHVPAHVEAALKEKFTGSADVWAGSDPY